MDPGDLFKQGSVLFGYVFIVSRSRAGQQCAYPARHEPFTIYSLNITAVNMRCGHGGNKSTGRKPATFDQVFANYFHISFNPGSSPRPYTLNVLAGMNIQRNKSNLNGTIAQTRLILLYMICYMQNQIWNT